MRHFPASCSDCRRLWLVGTEQAPSASPVCPRCGERGRLVPGAYYSDPGARIFMQLEEAIQVTQLGVPELRDLSAELERLLPSPLDHAIEAAFAVTMDRLGLTATLDVRPIGKRVALRMLAMIAGTLSEPANRESGVMRLPQTIPGLFDLVPKKRTTSEAMAASNESSDDPDPKRHD